jgi:hypothetical protein
MSSSLLVFHVVAGLPSMYHVCKFGIPGAFMHGPMHELSWTFLNFEGIMRVAHGLDRPQQANSPPSAKASYEQKRENG